MVEVTVYTTRICPYCHAARRLLGREGIEFREVSLDGRPELRRRLGEANGGWRTVPMVFVGDRFIGEHLTEVNFTSPTTIVQINEVMGKRADIELVNELERMREARAT